VVVIIVVIIAVVIVVVLNIWIVISSLFLHFRHPHIQIHIYGLAVIFRT